MSDEELIQEKVKKQAEMYLSGLSLREIAANTEQSHVTIRRNLTVKLKDIDLKLYKQVMNKMEENTPDSISKEEVVERVLAAYNKLILENKTVVEIADELDSTEFTIYRDLTKRLPALKAARPDLVDDKMLELTQEVLKRHSAINLLNNNKDEDLNIKEEFIENKESIMDVIRQIYPIKSRRNAFLCLATLTFGLSLDSLAEVLSCDKNDLYQNLMTQEEYKEVLKKLFGNNYYNQELSKERFEDFLARLRAAYLDMDNKKINEILLEIYDKDVEEYLGDNKSPKQIQDEELKMMLLYQLKYWCTPEEMGEYFKIDPVIYQRKVEEYLKKEPELEEYYHQLMLFHRKFKASLTREILADGGSKLYMDICSMFPNKDRRRAFLNNVAISFGLNLDTLSSLLGIDGEILYNMLVDNSMSWPIYYLFHYRNANQDKGLLKFNLFIRSLKKANSERDMDKIRETLNTYIGDAKAKKIIATRKSGDTISNMDIDTIMRYQVKYGLTSLEIASRFNIDSVTYLNRTRAYVNSKDCTDEDLKTEYTILLGVSRSIRHETVNKG